MADPIELRTDRLELRPISIEDAEELFPIMNDPDGWWYEPEQRHLAIETTRGFAERASTRWGTDGLSYWSVRRLGDPRLIGLGGVQRHRCGGWNLSYRFASSAQGNGYATELALAGIAAAGRRDAGVPVIAWILGHNAPSIRVAERAGLRNYGLRMDANDGIDRLAYADRPV